MAKLAVTDKLLKMSGLLELDRSTSGVYAITNRKSGRWYVGSSQRVRDRLRDHARRLIAGTHTNAILQKAWKAYGPFAFRFVLLEVVDVPDLIDAEQAWIDHIGFTNLYNLAPLAGRTVGFQFSPEQRQALKFRRRPSREVLRMAHLGKRMPEIARLAMIGRRQSEATRLKRSDSLKRAWAEGRMTPNEPGRTCQPGCICKRHDPVISPANERARREKLSIAARRQHAEGRTYYARGPR